MADQKRRKLLAQRNGDTVLLLVDMLTDKKNSDLSTGELRALKAQLKHRPAAIPGAFELLMSRLSGNHSQVRYLALLLIEELFARSVKFRELLVGRFSLFLESVVGHNPESALPAPPRWAAALREKGLGVLQTWVSVWGGKYPQIVLGHRYLKDTLRMKFPDIPDGGERARREEEERRERTRALLVTRYGQICEEWREHQAAIGSCLLQMRECLGLITNKKHEGEGDSGILESDAGGSSDGRPEMAGEQWEDVAPAPWEHLGSCPPGGRSAEEEEVEVDAGEEEEQEGLAAYAVEELPEELVTSVEHDASQCGADVKVQLNLDPVLVDTLQELMKSSSSQYLPQVQRWLHVVVHVDFGTGGDARNVQRQGLLRELVTLKNDLQRILQQGQEVMLNITDKPAGATAPTDQGPRKGQRGPSTLGASSQAAGGSLQDASLPSESSVMDNEVRALQDKGPALCPWPCLVEGRDMTGVKRQPCRLLKLTQNAERALKTDRMQKRAHDPTTRLAEDPHWTGTEVGRKRGLPDGDSGQDRGKKSSASPPAGTQGPEKQQGHPKASILNSSSIPEEVKRKLLAEAPVLPSGANLDHWLLGPAAGVIHNPHTVSGHWGAFDSSRGLPQGTLDSLFNTVTSYYQPGGDKNRPPQATSTTEARAGQAPGSKPNPPPFKLSGPVTKIALTKARAAQASRLAVVDTGTCEEVERQVGTPVMTKTEAEHLNSFPADVDMREKTSGSLPAVGGAGDLLAHGVCREPGTALSEHMEPADTHTPGHGQSPGVQMAAPGGHQRGHADLELTKASSSGAPSPSLHLVESSPRKGISQKSRDRQRRQRQAQEDRRHNDMALALGDDAGLAQQLQEELSKGPQGTGKQKSKTGDKYRKLLLGKK